MKPIFLQESLKVLVLVALMSAGARSACGGTLLVRGEVGSAQVFGHVKALLCGKTAQSCTNDTSFPLNKAVTLPAGDYLVGFEGSIYPGLVKIPAQGEVKLDLQRIYYPQEMVNEQRVKVFRDFHNRNGVELKKKAMEIFYGPGSLFRLARHSFGDLYLAGVTQREVATRVNSAKACQNPSKVIGDPGEGVDLCQRLTNLKSTQTLIRLVPLELKPDFIQIKWLSSNGYIVEVEHPRYLVAAPILAHNLRSGASFVSVFPGSYRFVADSGGLNPISVTTPGIPSSF